MCHLSRMTHARNDHDHILSEIDISADPFAICALHGTCSLGLGRGPGATLHYVLGGQGQVLLPGSHPMTLTPGCLVLVPANASHSLLSTGIGQTALPACRPAGMDIEEHIARGEGGGALMVLCARITLSLRGTHGLIDLLRAPLTLELTHHPGARRAIEALLHEMSHPRNGRRAMVRALLLQCMIEMLRNRLDAGDAAVAWLGGLADPRLWHSLGTMLDDPGAPHSLESLAAVAGLSRSRFAARFQAAYGHTPMHFLRTLRLARAAQLLCDGRDPVKRIAQKVGFSSRSAFSRAFTQACGQTPRAYRASSIP